MGSMIILDEELQAKIHRRAARAFKLFDEGSSEHVTRCHHVTRERLRYRISHKVAGTDGYYSGPQVLIIRVFPRRWWNPTTWRKKPLIIVPDKVPASIPAKD